MPDEVLIGKVGRVTDRVRPSGGIGAIILNVRGGSEEFAAMSQEEISPGSLAVVVEQLSPRTVLIGQM